MSNPDVDRIAPFNWEAISPGVLRPDDLDGPSRAQIASMLHEAEDCETGPWPLPVDYAWQKLSTTGYWTPFWAHFWGNPDPLDDLDGFAFNITRVLLPPSLRMPQLYASGGRMFVTEDFARLRLRILKMWTAINMNGMSRLRGGEPANEWVCVSIAGIILTGQPGVGKSVFIIYLLIFLLQHKQRVAFSTEQSVLDFRYDGVYLSKYPDPVINMPCTPLNFWSLIDTSAPARYAVTYDKAFPVHAVDCLDCNPPWTKCEYIKAFTWGMRPWSNVVALTAAVKLDRRVSTLTDLEIHELIRKYGPIPRTIIEAAPDILRFDEMLMDRLDLAQFKQVDLDLRVGIAPLEWIAKSRFLPPDVQFPYEVFLIEPIPAAKFAASDTGRIRFVSEHVKNLAEKIGIGTEMYH